MSEELKPCPFCGGEAEVTFEVDGLCSVECTRCSALVDGVEAWNTRAVDDENAELRELVADLYEAMCDVSETWAEDVCADRMHELGIEVDG